MKYLNAYHRFNLHRNIGREIFEEYGGDLSYYDNLDKFIESHKEWLVQMKKNINDISVNFTETREGYEWYSYGIFLLKAAVESEGI